MTTYSRNLFLAAGLVLVVLLGAGYAYWFSPQESFLPGVFDGGRAYADLEAQLAFGPRVPGTEAHAHFIEWAVSQLDLPGWDVMLQETEFDGQLVRNIVARHDGTDPEGGWIILAAHYDSRPRADRDPDPEKRLEPVPGANDGASGVAVLLELARVLPSDAAPDVWVVLFDAEDSGGIEGADWSLGAQAFVAGLDLLAPGRTPDQVVVLDMIGDADLGIYLEVNSESQITGALWQTARDLGYGEHFLPLPRYSMLDDHTPFLQAGLPAALVIDFDYPYWHTTADTADKTSPESLRIVGDTMLAYLLAKSPTCCTLNP